MKSLLPPPPSCRRRLPLSALIPRLLLFVALATVPSVRGQVVHTPAKDSPERRAIMDAIRVPCERDLRQDGVIFKVEQLRVTEDWAYAAVTPLRADGEGIDYRRTKFKAQVEAGMFDPLGEALLRQQGDGSWKVTKWRFGGTDTALPDWVKTEGAPRSLDGAEATTMPGSPPSAGPGDGGAVAGKAGTAGLKTFLLSTEGTYGWSPVEGSLSYDFFPDGRLHVQGRDGEATMWEGKWRLDGDQLTLVNRDKNTTRTVTATRKGAELLLDGKPYRRSRP